MYVLRVYVLVRSVWCAWVVLAGEEGAIWAAAHWLQSWRPSAFVHAHRRPFCLIIDATVPLETVTLYFLDIAWIVAGVR